MTIVMENCPSMQCPCGCRQPGLWNWNLYLERRAWILWSCWWLGYLREFVYRCVNSSIGPFKPAFYIIYTYVYAYYTYIIYIIIYIHIDYCTFQHDSSSKTMTGYGSFAGPHSEAIACAVPFRGQGQRWFLGSAHGRTPVILGGLGSTSADSCTGSRARKVTGPQHLKRGSGLKTLQNQRFRSFWRFSKHDCTIMKVRSIGGPSLLQQSRNFDWK